jgi:transcriptional regulator with XRE-family HTH domain
VSDLSRLEKFQNDEYRVSYLDSHVKGSIAYQIRDIREKLGLTQAEFGVLVGMPQAVISRLESGEGGGVNVNTLLKIANGLKIGLAVGFCNFETILKADVSVSGLSVESIAETVNRISSSAPQPSMTTTYTNTVNESVGAGAWLIQQIPNHSVFQVFPASGTLSFETFTPTPVLLELHPST